MPSLTQDQIDHSIRWIITTVSGMLTGYLLSKGWLTSDSAGAITVFFLGFAPTVATYIWGFISHSVPGTIASASKLPEVQSIVTTQAIATSPQFMKDNKVIS